MADSVVDFEVESRREMKDFPVGRAEFDAQLGGVDLRGRRERERKKA
jgi:hypothetical protein